MIFRFGRLTTTYFNRYKNHMSSVNYIGPHSFDYIVFRVKFGLTSCEELAMPLYARLNNWLYSSVYGH